MTELGLPAVGSAVRGAVRGAVRSVVLLRHGQTDSNLADRAQGQSDIAMNPVGHQQAARVASEIAKFGPQILWSSDLVRAVQTAEYVSSATGLPIASDPRLREISVGDRTGLTKPEFAERFPDEYAAWLRGDESLLVPGAETRAEVAKRVGESLRELFEALSPGRVGVAVVHGGCLKIAVAELLGWPIDLAESLKGIGNCTWARLSEHPQQPGLRLVEYNVSAAPEADGPHGEVGTEL